MANLRDKATKLTAKGFDLERKLLYPANSSLILLQRGGRTNPFGELRRFDAGFIVRYNSFRNQTQAEIATSENLRETVGQNCHFAFLGAVYAVGDGDIIEPFGDRFTWMLFGSIVGDRYEA